MKIVIELKKEELSRLNMYNEEAPMKDRVHSMRFIVQRKLNLVKEKDTLDLIIDGQRY
jgi:hypothetical protein